MIELCKRFLFQRQMWRNLYHHLPIIQSIMSKNSCNTNSNMQCTLLNPLINRIIKSCIKLEWTWQIWSCILVLDLFVHFYLIRIFQVPIMHSILWWMIRIFDMMINFKARTYLQLHYGNGVFGNVYLSAGQH